MAPVHDDVTGWLLAGGEGRRMQGQDKGLVAYRGQALGAWVLRGLKGQCGQVRISANRHLPQYAAMLRAVCGGDVLTEAIAEMPAGVWPDDADLGIASGPLAGLITALRHTSTPWVMATPCDMPHLPEDLVERLMRHAEQTNADVVIPVTQTEGEEPRHHWVCGLIHTRVCPDTVSQFAKGQRRVGHWVQSQRWRALPFPDAKAFANMNTLETLRDRD